MLTGGPLDLAEVGWQRDQVAILLRDAHQPHTLEVGAGGHQPRNDRRRSVVLERDEQHSDRLAAQIAVKLAA